MPLWRHAWPDGDVAIVEADDVDHALELLDEFGEAGASEVSEVGPGFGVLLSPRVETLDGELAGGWVLSELAAVLTDEGGPLDADEAARAVERRTG